MKEEQVILVDEHDRPLGLMGKLDAHRKGELHRAISILVFNDRNEIMLQQRAFTKYHTPGLWSNTCCSHPRPDESTLAAANRRLMEEMGFGCRLDKAIEFIYRASFGNGLIEHEYDHVYIGYHNQDPVINPEEVNAFRWISVADLMEDMSSDPELYTIWFRIIMERIMEEKPELLGK